MTEGDAEHLAFEAFCKENNLNRSCHPLHLLYLNHETSDALKIFKAGFHAAKNRDKFPLCKTRYKPCFEDYCEQCHDAKHHAETT